MRNPPWTRDELILALDLYFKVNPLHTSEKHPDIIALSELLNTLPIHPATTQQAAFRNPNGVYMKLCNFLRLDPTYQGEGLQAGSKLDEEVWKEYHSDHTKLSQIAITIKNGYIHLSRPLDKTLENEIIDEDEEFPEGKIITRLHKQKERNSRLVKQKKRYILQVTGKLACEVCSFDFSNFYGNLGKGFAECHHNVPLAELEKEKTVKLSELSVVCSNCHRMIHRIRPWLTVSQLKDMIDKNIQ
jgi:5-methylcytosine-specific restriction protein A